MDTGESQRRLEKLRAWRNRPQRDLTLGYLADHVKRTVTKPHKQLGQIARLWEQAVPPALADRTALVSLTHGVLTVHVADSSAMYELDRLLRGGVELRLRQSCETTLRKVKCRVAPM